MKDEDVCEQEGPKWNTRGYKWFQENSGGFIIPGSTVRNDGEWKRGAEVFADRVGMGGEESPIRCLIRARMSGKVCRTAARASGVVWFRGSGSRGRRGSKLEVTEIKMSRSSFRVTTGSGTEKKMKGEIYGCL